MNPHLSLLQPYPFEKLKNLFKNITPSSSYSNINLSIGEPKHATPAFVHVALTASAANFSQYPTTLGPSSLRGSISAWIARRHGVELDPDQEILPILGSREALFSFAQAVLDRSRPAPVVVMPNPFYQIYEGAAILAGCQPHYLNIHGDNGGALNFEDLSPEVWARTQLLYLCSPDNPTGRVLTLEEWAHIFNLADRYNFIIASDECYSEIYFDETKPPLGALGAAKALGRNLGRLIVFASLSKRSNVPGLRSGFVAGDAKLIKAFLHYRTYHGSAMSGMVAAVSEAAWQDEIHVRENRQLYAKKFLQLQPIINQALPCVMPEAAFYLWAKTPIDDQTFAQRLLQETNVTVLPGSLFGREHQGLNPGAGYVRIALVANYDACEEAAIRIYHFAQKL